MASLFKRRLVGDGERGQALILMMLLMTIVLLMGVITIDFGLAFSERNHLRAVADAAVLAGAGGLPDATSARAAALDYAKRNGYGNGVTNCAPVSGVTVCANVPPSQGPHSCSADPNCNNFIEVKISHNVGLEFGSIFGVGSISEVGGRAVSGHTNAVVPGISFAALNTTCQNHTLLIDNSGGTLEVHNDIYVNSCNLQSETAGCNDGDAFDVFGGGSLIAHRIFVVGGWELDGGHCNQSTVTCTADTVCPRDRLGSSAVLADPFAGVSPPSLGTPACSSTVYGGAQSYNPKQFLAASITTTTQTAIVSTGTLVQNGDMIVIDTEDMLVTGGGTTTLTVVRAQNGTTAATHNNGKEIKKLPVTGTEGTAANPALCTISSGTITLQPGTYYGGLKIQGTANVTLADGTYVMAGGGFQVLNSAKLTAPHVLIYNTQDPSHTGYADFVINTPGNVTLGPQQSGTYSGLTIFQDRASDKDIKILNTGNGINALSGTIYGANDNTTFDLEMGGTANLAVVTGKILLSADVHAIFNFDASGLFGTGVALIE